MKQPETDSTPVKRSAGQNALGALKVIAAFALLIAALWLAENLGRH